MDESKTKNISSVNAFQHGVPFLTQFNTIALSLKTLLKAPQIVSDRGSALIRMLPGSDYISRLSREARDPKTSQCLRYDEVSECVREHGILRGYRSENNSVSEAVISLFRLTNETMNFWTHFLPSVYFFWLFLTFCRTMPFLSDIYYLPFVCYMMSSCAYPLMSSIAHAFCCLSLLATHVCFFMDYATLSVYSWGAAMLYYNYVFPQIMIPSTYAFLFLPVAAIMALLTTFMACSSRFLSSDSTTCKMLRLGAFIIPYMWVSGPLLWRIFEHAVSTGAMPISLIHHSRQFIGVFLASFFYASHIPERFVPGKFDFLGNSHNLLHVFGIAATYEQLKGGLIDLEERRPMLESLSWSSSPEWVFYVTPLIVLTNVIIIIFFTNRIKSRNEATKKEK